MLVITFIAVYPLYYIYINSVSGGAYVGANEVIWYPKGFTTYAYSLVFQNSTIVRAFFNSVFYTVAGTLLSVTLTAFQKGLLRKKSIYSFYLIHNVFQRRNYSIIPDDYRSAYL